jgi:PAS domain S-box-containing protein
MNARVLADTRLIDGLPALKLLEGLARLYQLVLAVDRDGGVQWVSDELRRLSGSSHAHVGQDVHRVFPKLPQPEQLFAIRSQLPTAGFLSNMRIDVSDCDGGVLPVDLSILPISTEDSESPLMAVIARRVSDDDRIEDARGLEAVLESAPDGVVAVDERGFVTYANAAVERLLGYSREQLRGRPIALLAGHPADVERLASSLSPEEKVRDWDLELRCSGGSTVVVSASAGALRRADGPAGGTVLFLREGAHRRETEAALERENAELERCIQTLAHDLRSPLVALLGFSRLLRQDYGESLDDTGSHFLDRIEQSGRTMEMLIREILELSHIGHSGEQRSPVDPRAVLLQLGGELKPRLDAQGIRLSIPDTPPVLFCDRTRLYQVFSNLIGNAVDHMGPCDRPLISVRIEESADHHHLSVSDTGRGIPPEHHEGIFDAFRSLGSRTDGRRGTGIGLAIVRKIAETHSGRAWVESRPGAGATFHVTLSRS